MDRSEKQKALVTLSNSLEGDVLTDSLSTTIYATDASVYREIPLAVSKPKSVSDLQQLIAFAKKYKTSLIPRAAGTSLAGQCVGDGIIVDISKYFTEIITFNKEEQYVIVQPGVVRDELNAFLKPHGFFFSPITSTANRAMIGGMVGNNSSGTTSIEYGTTREHVLELKCILADGNEVRFNSVSKNEFEEKCKGNSLESKLYRQIKTEFEKQDLIQEINTQLPKASIHRRNTGYAIDYLYDSSAFQDVQQDFNFCKLLAGSEGTLAFTTEIKLHVDPLPLAHHNVVALHFTNLEDSLIATQVAMQHLPSACELMDKIILDCTKENTEQSKNRFFIEGDPEAVLMVELRASTDELAIKKAEDLISDMQKQKLGYAYPIIPAAKSKQVWALRSAGLGLLANIPGDKKAVACIEDTAVALEDLPAYIKEFSQIMSKYKQRSVYYAHAGAGEIHLRPILDLKHPDDRKQFHDISRDVALLVKKYRGSLSGEHGDGRVRAPFIPLVVGDKIYNLFKRIKATWDPDNIFNPGKIVEAAPMYEMLRYEVNSPVKEPDTFLDFSETGGILRAAEKCNGSGDCRKLPLSGGTMCPSYHATRNEKDSTRARANTLREFLTKSDKENTFDHDEIKEVMDLCLSCKACSSECPSNVDMTALKAEFTYQYNKKNGIPLRSKAFAKINTLNKLGYKFRPIANFFLTNKASSSLLKQFLSIATERSLPAINKISLKSWYKKNYTPPKKYLKEVYFFCDEFTNYNDSPIGIKAIKLLSTLGYKVNLIDHAESGRAALSKGLLEFARNNAERNVKIFSPLINAVTPLVGIEPSAILSFRDEYPRLVSPQLKKDADKIKNSCLLIDEFIAKEIEMGSINSSSFHTDTREVILHGHCHQKAISDIEKTVWILSLPTNYNVELIPSGCCGMAGSFGYEKEHYQLSMEIGNLVLFPAVKKAKANTLIAATGTSCRHQIFDGTKKNALHPIEILYEALIK